METSRSMLSPPNNTAIFTPDLRLRLAIVLEGSGPFRERALVLRVIYFRPTNRDDAVPKVTLRSATPEDAVWLDLWDTDADVIACSSDDPNATIAFAGTEWAEELAAQDEHSQYFIAELDGRPIGAMQICDPHLETSHYWGEIAPNLRAVDIWIGAPGDRGKGHGREMMRLALQRCFADSRVTGIVIDPLASNVRAHE